MVDGVGLQICKEVGPWFAYRALVVFETKPLCLDERDFIQEKEFGKRKDELYELMLTKVMDEKRMEWASKIDQLLGRNAEGVAAPFNEVWREWVDVRVDIGHQILGHAKSVDIQYSNEQIEYHYTRNKSVLRSI
jgi:hypothetical protein